MLFIYLIEGHPEFGPRVMQLRDTMLERNDTLYTSAFTLGEVLTGPLKAGDSGLVKLIKKFFNGGEIELLHFSPSTAEHYAEIRARSSVSHADAIHLAAAAQLGTDLFVTNDRRLHRLTIPGIRFIVGLEGRVF